MDATIIGKALTPISHECLLHLPQSNRENEWPTKKEPSPRWYTDFKPTQRHNTGTIQDQNLYDTDADRTKMNLTPIFRNMTLSETYNFARAQLSKYPVQHYKRRSLRTPNLSFPKVDRRNLNKERLDIDKQLEGLQSDAVIASCTIDDKEKAIVATSVLHSKNGHRQTKTVGGQRKYRRKSARRKKKSLCKEAEPQNSITLSRLTHSNTMSPLRTSSSLPSQLTLFGAPKRSSNQPPIDLMTQRIKLGTTHGTRTDMFQIEHSRQSPRKSASKEVSDPLLSSLDTSLNKKKSSPELSMRIKLIHRYGNEDVIAKHMEMRKRREIANRHEEKNLEMRANERRKEEQRLKIYALNKLMTKLEQEQFEEYKQSL